MNKALRISIVVVICLIVILAVALLISQCSSKDPEDTTTTTTTEPTTTTTTVPSETTPSETTPSETTPSDDPVVDPEPDNFTETNDKVYVTTTKLNIRSSAEIPDGEANFYKNVVGTVDMDAELERIGYDSNGWSKIRYKDQECYVGTASVTTEKPITDFTDKEEVVYVVPGVNPAVYSKPSHLEDNKYSEVIGTIYEGQEYTRLGVAETVYKAADGKEYTFAKITFEVDGESFVGYVNNVYLTTAEATDAGVVFEECSDVLVVIAETSIALRKSTLYVEGDNSEIAKYAFNGDELQATHKGVENDANNTVWYKVVVDKVTYYVIFNEANLQIKTPAAE